jgi:ubiquitin-activating enzyme E1 C
LYLQSPPQLEEATRPNLLQKMSTLVEEGDEVSVTSASLPFSLNLKIRFS